MPIARFQMPDGKIARFEVPEGTTPEQAQAMMAAHFSQSAAQPAPAKLEPDLAMSTAENLKQAGKDIVGNLGNLVAGGVRGAGSIGATLLYPIDKAMDVVKGDRTGSPSRNEERRAEMDAALRTMGADTDTLAYKGGKLGAEIAGTAGVGGALGNGVRAISQSPRAIALANALTTGGMKAGATPGVANMLTRILGGGVTGGATAAMVNPEDAKTGAMIGAALPPALKVAGSLGGSLRRTITGPEVPDTVSQAVAAARDAGYVIPPSQAKPTLFNRALEGFSGKIATAQNASARNQPITNELAKSAIGATELSEAGLAQVRNKANAAYDALGQVGAFKSDAGFAAALDKAGSSTSELRKNFPELVNSEIDDLIAGLKSRTKFDAQPTIEAIKQFRSNASANRISTDPAKKALGKAQSNIAGALEDLIDRNLQEAGNPALLSEYRAARQTLAKTYDVEKALNVSSGNVDAQKLAAALKKGRPLNGELRQIADFAAQFPKAAQTVEKMGSLPQVSPLDFGALGTVSALTSNPLLMAGVLARPAARATALSGAVQNRLVSTPQSALAKMLMQPSTEQLLYRAAPVVSTQ